MELKEGRERLWQESRARGEEAEALMDRAEEPGRSRQERERLLRRASSLLLHSPFRPASVARAIRRLHILLPHGTESERK